MPSLNALRCFEAAARFESFSRAADQLNMTHGAVSRAVRLIEEDFGILLFERRQARVFLTEDGMFLARAVSEGFGQIAAACADLRVRSQNRPMTLSCEPTLLMRWLIPRLPDLQARHAGLLVHLVAGGGPVTLGNGIDLAIRRNDFRLPDSCHATPLFREKIGPVCRIDQIDRFFDLSGDGPPTLRPTATLLHARTRPDAWAHWAELSGTRTRAASEQSFDHFYFSLQAAAAGIGVAIGPWHLVRDDIEDGILAAPGGFLEDGSNYVLLAPRPVMAGSREALLAEWLESSGR